MELPPFKDDGLLPPGNYVMSLEELKGSMLVGGPRKGIRTGIHFPFPSAFRLSRREYKPKGIVKIVVEEGGESA